MGAKPCPAPPPPEGGDATLTCTRGTLQPIRGQCSINKDKLTCAHDPNDHLSGTQIVMDTVAKTSTNLEMPCQQNDLALPGNVTAICQNPNNVWELSMIGPKDNKNPVFACGGIKDNMCLIPAF